MAKEESKRFQSGREIMERYVPGYQRTTVRGEVVDLGPNEARGTEMANSLLKNFKASLSSIRLRSTGK